VWGLPPKTVGENLRAGSVLCTGSMLIKPLYAQHLHAARFGLPEKLQEQMGKQNTIK
jgi:hypothetical protein